LRAPSRGKEGKGKKGEGEARKVFSFRALLPYGPARGEIVVKRKRGREEKKGGGREGGRGERPLLSRAPREGRKEEGGEEKRGGPIRFFFSERANG